MVSASDRSVVVFSLSGDNVHDAKAGYALLEEYQRCKQQKYLIMDKAYEGDALRNKAVERGFIPVVPPKSNRKQPWDYDKGRYKQRNEIERYFLRLKKRFRKIFTRYDKLDVLFSGFIYFAMVADTIISVNTL
jgi:transposase